MTMTDSLDGLIERVERCTGPDRDLDIDLCLALNYVHCIDGSPVNLRRAGDYDDHWLDYEVIENGCAVECADRAPDLTASIDVALALVEVLFGVGAPALCYSYDLNYHCYAHANMAFVATLHLAVGDPATMRTINAEAATLPLAILTALLSALNAEGNT